MKKFLRIFILYFLAPLFSFAVLLASLDGFASLGYELHEPSASLGLYFGLFVCSIINSIFLYFAKRNSPPSGEDK